MGDALNTAIREAKYIDLAGLPIGRAAEQVNPAIPASSAVNVNVA